jgi:hypothetical protein
MIGALGRRADLGDLAPMSRRFPPPRSVDGHDAKLGRPCFIVRDDKGHALAYVYFEKEPGRRSAAHCSPATKPDGIATNIAKLPDLPTAPRP